MKPHITYKGKLAGWRCEGPGAVVYADSPSDALRSYLRWMDPTERIIFLE